MAATKERPGGKNVAREEAAKLRAELEAIRNDIGGGILRPEQVVEFARTHPRSVLHRRFEWDDSEAAHEFRLAQARQIIRVVVTVVRSGNEARKMQAYVSLHDDRGAGAQGYRHVSDVVSDENMYAAWLAQARAEAQAFARKYREIAELRAVISAIDDLAA